MVIDEQLPGLRAVELSVATPSVVNVTPKIIEADTKVPCPICRERIEDGAKICAHCKCISDPLDDPAKNIPCPACAESIGTGANICRARGPSSASTSTVTVH